MTFIVLNNSGPVSLNIILQLTSITLLIESLTRGVSQLISVLCLLVLTKYNKSDGIISNRGT
jgi:hypothetical protein